MMSLGVNPCNTHCQHTFIISDAHCPHPARMLLLLLLLLLYDCC
jgi:hypothetical protein